MNLAIVIGVSKYSNLKDNLPGSKNDAESINIILKKTTKFDEILYINNGENSAETKELITNFISEYKLQSITEFFFYYSGHGEFSNDEFYYILSDFDTKKRKQTSLQNNEIDDLIRTLSPQLVVKVIDACQSGTSYIKEAGVLNKYFSDSQKAFKKCYFLNSSLNSQASFANEEISFFTFSFINAINEHKSGEIRYKDIIDVISDEFDNNREQTPLFIIQAELTEKFCKITLEMKEYVANIIGLSTSTKENEVKSLSLFEIITEDAKNYTDKEGAISAVNLIKERLNTLELNAELKNLYQVELEFLINHHNVINLTSITKWLESNEHDFFAEPIYELVYDEYNEQAYEQLIGIDLNLEVPFKTVSLDFISNFPNLLSYHSNIVYLLSKKYIRFFYFVTNYIESNWDDKKLNYSIKWFTTEYRIADVDDVMKGIDTMYHSLQRHIIDEIEKKFKIDDNDGEEDDLPF